MEGFGEFDGGESGSDMSGGEGSESGGNSIFGSIVCCCIGLFLFPAALCFSGWNEQRAVCRERAVLAAEGSYLDLSCSDGVNAANGNPLKSGNLGLLQCPLDKSTFKNFTSMDIPGCEGVSGLFGPTGQPATKIQAQTSMLMCTEHCVQEVCTRRLRSTEAANKGIDDVEAEATGKESQDQLLDVILDGQIDLLLDEEGGEEEEKEELNRSLLSRRLSSGRRRSCTKKCVQYGYNVQWVSSATDYENARYFKGTDQASVNTRMSVCGATVNPTENPALPVGPSKDVLAPSVKVMGGGWTLNSNQVELLTLDKTATLPPRSPTAAFEQSPVQPPPALTAGNTVIYDNTLQTCSNQYGNNATMSQTPTKGLGCLRITFKMSAPTQFLAIGAVGTTPGMFDPAGWPSPNSWMCTGKDYRINRVCPTSTMSVTAGFQSCTEDVTKEEIFDVMAGENNTLTWWYRLAGLVSTFVAVLCIFGPISAIVETAADMLDDITACIPGVGCIVDQMTDLVVGLVNCLICGISFMCAISCFSFVVAVMWVFMRPMIGIPLFLLTCCCCGGAIYVSKSCKTKEPRHGKFGGGGGGGGGGSGPMDAQTNANFLQALEMEYVRGKIGAVGDFFGSHPGSDEAFSRFEDEVRDSPNPEEAIHNLERMWGLGS